MPSKSKTKMPKRSVIAYDLAPNAKIWRYMDMAKFLDMLEGKRLFFVRGDGFEDKFEGSFTHTIKEAIKESYRVNKIDYQYEDFKKQLRQNVYINCWHKNNNDSIAMWRLYGGSNNSVAILSSVFRLANVLRDHPFDQKAEIKIDKVTYTNHWKDPRINFNPYSRVFFYKVRAYDYEKEIRAVLDTTRTHFEKAPLGDKGVFLSIDFPNLIEEIVTAPDAPDWFYKLIKILVQDRYSLDIPVRKSRLTKETPI